MANFTNYLLSCLNGIKNLYVNGFDDFMTLIEEKKVQDALSWADTFKWDENKLGSRRQGVREKVRKLAGQQSHDPVTAFKLLNILQKWHLNSVALDSLQDLELELILLYSLVRGNHFCEFWELLSQIQLRVKPKIFDFKSVNLFSVYEYEVHKLRKDGCEKIQKKCKEILELPLPLEVRTRMAFEISTFEGFNGDLKKQEEEMRKFLNDVLDEPLRELTTRIQSAETRSATQEVDLQQLRKENIDLRTKTLLNQASLQLQSESLRANTQITQEINQRFQTFEDKLVPLKDDFETLQKKIHENDLQRQVQHQDLKEQLKQLSSLMAEMDDKFSEQFKKFKPGFESFIKETVIERTNGFQKQIYALQGLCGTLEDQVLKNQKQNNQCEEDCKKAMQDIQRIAAAMKTQSEIEDEMPQEVDKQRKVFGSAQKRTEELLLACHIQQSMNEKMMRLLRMNFQQNFEASESQAASQTFSIKQSGPQQQEEDGIHIRGPKEKDADESGERYFDQEEKEEKTEQISEGAFQQNDKEENPSTQAINNNTWEIVGQDQG